MAVTIACVFFRQCALLFITLTRSVMVNWTSCAVYCHSRQLFAWLAISADSLVGMKVPAIVVCLLLRVLSTVADGVYSCPSRCRCTILKRQRDRATVASSEQSVAPGRKAVCPSSSPLITSLSQIPFDNLPKDTLHLYVFLCFILYFAAYCVPVCVFNSS